MSKLDAAYPDWQKVKLTKVGYSVQRLEAMQNIKDLFHEVVGHWYEENDPGGEAGKWELDLHKEIDAL